MDVNGRMGRRWAGSQLVAAYRGKGGVQAVRGSCRRKEFRNRLARIRRSTHDDTTRSLSLNSGGSEPLERKQARRAWGVGLGVGVGGHGIGQLSKPEVWPDYSK